MSCLLFILVGRMYDLFAECSHWMEIRNFHGSLVIVNVNAIVAVWANVIYSKKTDF